MSLDDSVRLTSFSHGAGCACKLSARDLQEVFHLIPELASVEDERLIVGLEAGDDAAVYEVREDLALVFTTDFFTPIVDDPYDWGRVAAANALSDVYAMGGAPLLALNLVAWPRDTLPFEMLAQVLEGGRSIANAADCWVVGGHSIDDAEPKYGMAVVGIVHPENVLRNSTAQVGDALVLTKPLGVGAITTAIKRGLATSQQVQAAVALMTSTNAGAAAAASDLGIGPTAPIHAGTDVTGFGLLGHLKEMLDASMVGADINPTVVPALDGALDILSDGIIASGTVRNHTWVSPWVTWNLTTRPIQHLLADAQTSGGLLLACAPGDVDDLLQGLASRGSTGVAIGSVTEQAPGTICMTDT